MSWVLQVVVFGFVALLFFIRSVASIQKKQYALGLAFGILELLSATVSSSAWAWALHVSGKSDWRLFGILNYTPLGLICVSMFVVGALCVIMGIWGVIKKNLTILLRHKS